MVDEQEARRCLVEMMMKQKGSRFRRNGQNGERDVASSGRCTGGGDNALITIGEHGKMDVVIMVMVNTMIRIS
jgi:hypothetical protein